jgi:FlaA1/EpsC-like NDP-sugar epimerase
MMLFGGLVLVLIPLTFYLTGVYSRYWRYASINENLLLAGALTVAVAFAGAMSLVIARLTAEPITFPRFVPVIFLMLALLATTGPRLLARMSVGYWRQRERESLSLTPHSNVLILGAGDAGAIIVRELKSNPQLGMRVVGFIDDDLAKHDALIHGVPVLGGRDDIAGVIRRHRVDKIIIAMPTVAGKVIGELVSLCERAGIHPKIMPGIYELIGGQVSISQLRNVQIEDLLRREPIRTDTSAVRNLLHGRRVLVTGGGGSIGSELCRQILRCEPKVLIAVGHGENSVFEIEHELRTVSDRMGLRHPRLVCAIADIRFPDRIQSIFEQHQPEIVFHAAAHKHVPLMESNPCEAITNNVFGTQTLLNASLAANVEHFVMISTDKAVRPTSVMGASKRVAELLVHQAAACSGKPYVAVRFGNVLGSRGSVVLTFKRQIANGGPVTVTHPDMTRYFMTIPEAVQLVLQAAVLGKGGEVFLLDMGEPVKIADLAKSIIELSGLEVGKDIEIEYTGVRPGEKLYEELFLPDEVYQRTEHAKVFIASNASTATSPDLNEMVSRLTYSANVSDKDEIVRMLRQLIPEYQPNGQY